MRVTAHSHTKGTMPPMPTCAKPSSDLRLNWPLPRAFYLVLTVQFISTLADNAFLIVAIARVMELAEAGWRIPVLKIAFTLFYVVLAPIVGPVSDSFRKGRVMLGANAFKVAAMLLLLTGADPLWAIAVAGWGAAVYAPAKYGLMTELLPPHDLVRANGYFEGATVCAVIFGTVLGGLLISPLMPTLGWPLWMNEAVVHSPLSSGMIALLGLNGFAMLLCVGVVDSGARYPKRSIHPATLIRQFWQENKMLWRDHLGGTSMAVTTLLWGVGATLQLIVLRWANESLGLSLEKAAYLQGVTALGVVLGAVGASRYIKLAHAVKLLPVGLALGAAIPILVAVDTVVGAVVLLVGVGALAGFFVVPMNALLQHRGCTLLTAGRSIAVQGFNENAGMLAMLAIYAIAVSQDITLHSLIVAFGVIVMTGMGIVIVTHRRNR